MRIVRYLNTTEKDVVSKKHNIWIGVSLGNKYFNPQNIKKYLEWAVPRTKENVLVVVTDKLHAINLEVLDGRSKPGSLRRAYALGDEKVEEIQEVLSELDPSIAARVVTVRADEVTRSKYHDYRLEVVFEEFKNNKEFHDYICSIVTDARSDRSLSLEKVEKLAGYVLQEIPIFINGVKHKKEGEDWKTYDLIPYPGLTKLDELFIGLQDKTMFRSLAERLKITDRIAIVEAYVD